MDRDLKIILVECDIVWESPEQNMSLYNSLLDRLDLTDRVADIVIFPEFFNVGFTMNPECAEGMDGVSVNWMRRVAQEKSVAVVGSLPILDNGEIFNRAIFITPEGDEFYYDKKHLFRMGEEPLTYTPGKSQCVISYKSWNILLNICYDLRFPVWTRNVDNRYDLILNVASWPDKRIKVTEPLIKARAIENGAYFAFVNRIGSDPSSEYNGHSRVVDFYGNDIGETIEFEEKEDRCNLIYSLLSHSSLKEYRERFPVWLDADRFTIG